MCGIYLALSRKGPIPAPPNLLELLRNRGPDHVSQVVHEVSLDQGNHEPASETSQQSVFISCASSVLSLRGNATVEQPATLAEELDGRKESAFLCWNGEAWTFAGAAIQGNDSEHILRLLSHVSAAAISCQAKFHEQAIAEALASYSGPYAFAFYEPLLRRLYFGRDLLGRRSLLYRTTSEGELVLSSVPEGAGIQWTEVETDGIHFIDLDIDHSSPDFRIQTTPYCFGSDANPSEQRRAIRPLILNKGLPPPTADDHFVPEISNDTVNTMHRLLAASLKLRVKDISRMNTTNTPDTKVRPAKIAVLFSGGLDCTLLARLAHDLLEPSEPIDLLNVAFQNPRVQRNNDLKSAQPQSPYEQCPDRVTGRSSYEELKHTCPTREWRFVAVDVPYPEMLKHRNRVMSLMHPHNTEMDLSIACALYFAARGAGTISADEGSVLNYTTTARVLLSGLGADELFGGYARHATAFSRGGYAGLADELELDVSRLGKRNLGRDDRVISNWAREARFPFLDERLVNWSLSIPTWQKCGFGSASKSTIDPTKQLLRHLALKLNMPRVSNEKKRAIQFGARTAKMEVGRSKGTDVLVVDG
ncbi:hypothetical protein MBLNU457_5635t1 [Dothideomycetes sp. NU457]